MRVNDNGIYRDATPEEIAEMERMEAEHQPPDPTPEERLAKLEAENADLKEALNMILTGVVQ